jgi:hypothetical protein
VSSKQQQPLRFSASFQIMPFAKKVIKKKKRTAAKRLIGIKQGVGAITTRPFPRPVTRNRKPKAGGSGYRLAFNALSRCHLPLPRAVGGYTIIRTTDIINTSSPAMLFGCFKGPGLEFTETTWTTSVAVSPRGNPTNSWVGLTQPIGDAAAPGNSYFYSSEALAATALNGARMVPAAITVQVMNGDALQTTNGIAYIGRSKTVLDLMGDARSWDTVMKQLVSYSAPRLCSAGKLALRGVQVNAVPNNLSVLSDFVPRRIKDTGTYTWTENAGGTAAYADQDIEGFAPIFIYNPDNIALKYLVTIEWRVRFDPFNPAYAGHSQHMPASEATWASAVQNEENKGSGVTDIVEDIAELGVAAAMMGAI